MSEIERKFVLEGGSELTRGIVGVPIRQGYLAAGEAVEVRLRAKGDRHFLTVKSGSGLVREEREVELGPEQFEALWPATEDRRIEKTRYEIGVGELVVELDIYHGVLDGLCTAELEFASEEEARSFEPPGWLGREVTEDGRYANRNLALRGRPPEIAGDA
jgi:CYTH domain-containing protein